MSFSYLDSLTFTFFVLCYLIVMQCRFFVLEFFSCCFELGKFEMIEVYLHFAFLLQTLIYDLFYLIFLEKVNLGLCNIWFFLYHSLKNFQFAYIITLVLNWYLADFYTVQFWVDSFYRILVVIISIFIKTPNYPIFIVFLNRTKIWTVYIELLFVLLVTLEINKKIMLF